MSKPFLVYCQCQWPNHQAYINSTNTKRAIARNIEIIGEPIFGTYYFRYFAKCLGSILIGAGWY